MDIEGLTVLHYILSGGYIGFTYLIMFSSNMCSVYHKELIS